MADDLILDDPAAMVAADPGLMLLAVASSGAQVRMALDAFDALDPAALNRLDDDGRPRGVVISGMGGSGIVGATVAALAARTSSVPVVAVNDYQLPAWVGAVDVVIAVSCSGETEETLSSAAEAVRRGCRLVVVGARDSSLHRLAVSVPSALFLEVDARGRMPRASLWTLLTPVLLVAERLGIMAGARPALVEAADRLDEIAVRCGLEVPLEVNEAKTLGLALAESLPMVWGTGNVGAVAAYRLACQLNENAKMPVVVGALPEASHNQVVALDGSLSTSSESDLDDLFRDRVSDPDPSSQLRLFLVRDSDEHPRVAIRATIAAELAQSRGIEVATLQSGHGHPILRLVDLVGVIDWASVYAALALGVDPSPIGPIVALKERLAH